MWIVERASPAAHGLRHRPRGPEEKKASAGRAARSAERRADLGRGLTALGIVKHHRSAETQESPRSARDLTPGLRVQRRIGVGARRLSAARTPRPQVRWLRALPVWHKDSIGPKVC